MDSNSIISEVINFTSQGLRCEAQMTRPAKDKKIPVVVMGHGYGAERDFGNNNTVESFVAMGCAVLRFDYRYFGGSDGQPRQLTDPKNFCQDWLAALEFVRGLDYVDRDSLFIWGSSFGGGHVLTIAAQDRSIAGVIALVPHCDTRTIMKATLPGKALRSVAAALLDTIAGVFGMEYRVPLVGKSGEGFSVLDYPGWQRDYLRLASHSKTWKNSIPARSLLKGSNYNPVDTANLIECPVLILSGEFDPGIAREDVLRTVQCIRACQHTEYAMGHFDLYEGGAFNLPGIEQQRQFISHILGIESTEPSSA